MSAGTEDLRRAIVGLADLVRDAYQHGVTARFSQRAPVLLEEARLSLKLSSRDATQLTPSESQAIQYLLEFAQVAQTALDDSVQLDTFAGHLISEEWYDEMAGTIAAINQHVPDDRPGYTMGWATRLQWALRRFVSQWPPES
jgi:hypothetical protein